MTNSCHVFTMLEQDLASTMSSDRFHFCELHDTNNWDYLISQAGHTQQYTWPVTLCTALAFRVHELSTLYLHKYYSTYPPKSVFRIPYVWKVTFIQPTLPQMTFECYVNMERPGFLMCTSIKCEIHLKSFWDSMYLNFRISALIQIYSNRPILKLWTA